MKRPSKPGRKDSRSSRNSDRKSPRARTSSSNYKGRSSGDRPSRSDDRPFSSDRNDRPRRTRDTGPRDDRPLKSYDKPDGEKRAYTKRDDSSDRPSRYNDRDEKPRRSFDKPDGEKRAYTKRADSSDRPSRYNDRDEKPRRSFDKPDGEKRPYVKREDRDDRPPHSSDRDDHPRRSYDKPEGSAARFYSKRDDRPDRSSRGSDGDDRPRKSFDRPDDKTKRAYVKREDRPARPTRDSDSDDRPRRSYIKPEGEKRAYTKRDDRPSKSFDDDSSASEKPFKKFGGDEDEDDEFIPPPKERKSKSKSFSGDQFYSDDITDDQPIRLNRYISMAGICSRREADEMIEAGLFSVNGKIATELGMKVRPSDDVRYNGERIKNEKPVYLLLNKPKDYITTMDDPEKRQTVMDLIGNACKERIYPVGRLDRNTTGLLLFTNDGPLAKRLTHPSSKIRKIYHVELDKSLKVSDMKKLVEGIEIEESGMVQVDDISYDGDGTDKKMIGVEIHSGQNRVVRRMFEALGYEVRKLDRVVFAGLTKKDLPRGRWRFLSEKEVGMLKMVTGKETKVKAD